MQRRRLLVSAAGAVAAIAATPAARGLAAPGAPGDPTVMHARAKSLMEASRLRALTESLPSWIASAAAAAADASSTERQRVTGLHARLLAIAAQTAYRTGDEGAAAEAAAAALRLADDAGDPLARAEAARVAAVVRRRAGDPAATGHMMSAADALEQATALRAPAALAFWAETVCSTAYTASVFAAFDDADALLAEVRQRLEAFEGPLAFTVTDVDVFAMSAAMRAGRYDRVLARADRVDLDQVTTTHQRAHLHKNVAIAASACALPGRSVDALEQIHAEAPDFLVFRPWAREIAGELAMTGAGARSALVRSLAG